MKKVIGFSLSEEVITRLDFSRGMVSRSAYVEDILRKELGLKDHHHLDQASSDEGTGSRSA